jgi:enoyl-CoA hydratase/carnithine racemase
MRAVKYRCSHAAIIAESRLLSGDRIGAEEAYRIGLVNRIHPRDGLDDEALALAGRIASRAPLAVQAAAFAEKPRFRGR